mmetsp:Transcript_1312/g.3794  ORF Transcript_1312/g.3794 Transcript_1312/m.3794 type:complete len:246 (-) Transcript_1312:216-953(-)
MVEGKKAFTTSQSASLASSGSKRSQRTFSCLPPPLIFLASMFLPASTLLANTPFQPVLLEALVLGFPASARSSILRYPFAVSRARAMCLNCFALTSSLLPSLLLPTDVPPADMFFSAKHAFSTASSSCSSTANSAFDDEASRTRTLTLAMAAKYLSQNSSSVRTFGTSENLTFLRFSSTCSMSPAWSITSSTPTLSLSRYPSSQTLVSSDSLSILLLSSLSYGTSASVLGSHGNLLFPLTTSWPW